MIENQKKNMEKGITLIALIVTIIVLVILSVVAINLVFDTGVVNQATKGSIDYVEESVKEEKMFNEVESIIESTIGRNRDYFKENGTINGEEGNSFNPTIPKGFKAVDTEISDWGLGKQGPSVEDVNVGLVIEDKNGNQFVWVPCTSEDGNEELAKYGKDTTYNTGVNILERDYKQFNDWQDSGANEASIKKYGGFYVARYEAGVPEDNENLYVTKDNYKEEEDHSYYDGELKNTDSGVPVSKANVAAWNFINRSNAMTVSKNMYNEESSFKSSLMDSSAWDTIVNWMAKTGTSVTNSQGYGNYFDDTGNTAIKIDTLYALHIWNDKREGAPSNVNSGWAIAKYYRKGEITTGNELINADYENNRRNFQNSSNYPSNMYTYYLCKELATGASTATLKNNIYDMAGNMWEWTTEIGNHGYGGDFIEFAVVRGGSFKESGLSFPICSRNGENASSMPSVDIGFRVVLYLV